MAKKPRPRSTSKPKAKRAPKVKAPQPRVKRKRKRTPREVQIAPRGERADLLEAIDDMVSYVPGGAVSTRQAPASKSRTPWMLLSSFYAALTYDDVLIALRGWRDDRTIERHIRPQRLSRIQVRYVTDRGKEGEYTLAEIGPWELAVSRAVERVGVRDDKDEALIERYGEGSDSPSEIDAIIVWFSSHTVESLSDSPEYSFGIGREVENEQTRGKKRKR